MDTQGRFCISAPALYSCRGTELVPIVFDVRRSPGFDADDTVIVGAVRRLPEKADHWRSSLPEGRSVVVYCVHGQEVTQNTAAVVRAAARDACLPPTRHRGLGRTRAAASPQTRRGFARMGHPRAAQNRPHLADPPLH